MRPCDVSFTDLDGLGQLHPPCYFLDCSIKFNNHGHIIVLFIIWGWKPHLVRLPTKHLELIDLVPGEVYLRRQIKHSERLRVVPDNLECPVKWRLEVRIGCQSDHNGHLECVILLKVSFNNKSVIRVVVDNLLWH